MDPLEFAAGLFAAVATKFATGLAGLPVSAGDAAFPIICLHP